MADKLLSQMNALTPNALTDKLYATDSAGANEGSTTKQDIVDLATPYKTYVAFLAQTAQDAPVANVLENTLGGTVVWTRSGAGRYIGTLSGAFTADKTMINNFSTSSALDVDQMQVLWDTSGAQANGYYKFYRVDDDSVEMRLFDSSASLGTIDFSDIMAAGRDIPINIRVYN